MNKIYKTVWSAKKGTYVAVSEIVTNRGKEAGGSEGASTSKPSGRLKTLASILLSIGFASGLSYQAVAQEANTADIQTVLGTTYNGSSFVIPSNGIGGTNQSNVFGAIGKVQGDLTSLTDGSSVTISNLDSRVTTNAGNISKNTNNISTLTTSLGTANTNISGNTTAITGLKNNLDIISANVDKGLSVKANNGTADKLNLGETLTLADGTNTTVSYNADTNTFKTNLNPNISLTSVTTSGVVAANSLSVTKNATVSGTLNVTGLSTLSGGANLGGNKITNLADGSIASSSSDAVTGGQIHNILFGDDAKGIKYFRVNSDKDDAKASGEDSIAIGPLAKAEKDGSIAVGHTASADGIGSIALGDGAKITSTPASDSEAAISIGKDSSASALNGVAIGNKASVIGSQGIALGDGAVAGAKQNISIGFEAGKGTYHNDSNTHVQNIAIGTASGKDVHGQNNLAIGFNAGQTVGTESKAADDNISIGRGAGNTITGDENISIGLGANTGGVSSHRSIAIGSKARASNSDSIALGASSHAQDNNTIAIGLESSAAGGGVALGSGAKAQSGHIALGADSVATNGDVVSNIGAFTGKEWGGSVVSVGSKDGSEGAKTRRIVNVADGAGEFDAVNVRQLQAVVDGFQAGLPGLDYDEISTKVAAKMDVNLADLYTPYVSINSTQISNRDNKGATKTDAIAIGPMADADAAKATVIGNNVQATEKAESAVVIGTSVKGKALNTVAIGNSNSEARDESGIAIGTNVRSRDENSIVIGRNSQSNRQGGDNDNDAGYPSVDNSIVIGTNSTSSAVEGIVIGKTSTVSAPRGIAQGSNAVTNGADGTAIGTGARATAARGQALGTSAQVYGKSGIAFGDGAVSGIANEIGQQHAIAIGTGALATYDSSIATGRLSSATADFALASGYKAVATKENAVALGAGAEALQAGNVALGAGSITENVHEGKYYINDATSGFTVAGKRGTGTNTVSVGTKGNERQIQHVAPGVVSETSTDAINGSQLHATNLHAINLGTDTAAIFGGNTTLQPNGKLSNPNFKFNYDGGKTYQNVQAAMSGLQSLGMNFAGDSGTPVHRDIGQTLDVKGGATGKLTDNNIAVVTNNLNALNIKLAQNIDLGTDGSVLTGTADSTGLLQGSLLDKSGLNVITSGGSSTNVGAGSITVVGGGNAIAINGSSGDITGLTNQTLTDPSFATKGRAATEEQLKIVNTSLVETGLRFDANTGSVQTAALGSIVAVKGADANTEWDDFDAGENIMTQIVKDEYTGNNVIRVALAKEIEGINSIIAGKDGVDGIDGIIGVNGKDGASVVLNGADGSIGLTGPRGANGSDGVSTNISVKDGAPGLNGEPGTTTTRIVYTDENNNPQEVANLNDGLKFVGDDGQVVSRKLNQTLGLTGGARGDLTGKGNIGVVQDGEGGLSIQLAKVIDLTEDGSLTVGDTVVNDKGLVVHDDTSNPTATTTVTAGKIELFANPTSTAANTIVIDADKGTVEGLSNRDLDVGDFATVGRAATEEQLVAYGDELTATGIRFDANTGGVQTAALGSIVAVRGADTNTTWTDFDAGENIMTQIVKDNVTGDNVIRVALAKDITGIETIILGENGTPGKDGADGAPGIGLDGKDGVIGITGKDGIAGADGIDGMPGASADITVKQGAPGIDGNDGADGESKTRIVYEKPDGTVEEVATLNDGLYFQGDQADDGGNVARKLNETLNLSGGESDATKLAVGANIGIIKNEAGNGYDFLLAKDLTGLNTIQIGGDTGAPVTLGGNADGSLVLNPGGAAAKITNVAPGAINSDSTDAINGSQLQAMGDSLTQFFGEGMEFTDGSFNWDNYFTNIFGEGSDITNLAQALEPWNAGTGGGNSAPVLPGDNVDISPVAPGSGSGGAGGGTGVGGSGNIVVNLEHDGTDHNYTLDLADNIHVNQSITVGNTEGSYISMGDDGNAGSAGSLNFYGEPDADGNRVSASQTVVAGPGGVGTDQSANDGTRLQYTDGEGNVHTLATLGDGLSFGANDGAQHDAALNTRVDIVGAATNTDWSKFDAGQNIMTQVTTNEDGTGRVTVALSNDLKVESVTATTVNATTVNATTVNATTVNADSVAINNGGPVINNQGINMNDNRITNVAPGVDGSDAVNVDQLMNVGNHLQNQINDNRHQIKRNNDRANAGIAAAMATAGLPQAYLPGKSMVAVAGGVWRGESGVAIGVSTVSENGKWILKGSANTSGRGGAGGTIGAGYQW